MPIPVADSGGDHGTGLAPERCLLALALWQHALSLFGRARTAAAASGMHTGDARWVTQEAGATRGQLQTAGHSDSCRVKPDSVAYPGNLVDPAEGDGSGARSACEAARRC
jgi:hypothetical protein